MPAIKGTASVSDSRALSKALKSINFPANFSSPVDISKVNRAVLAQWIETRVTEILGFEDEIVYSTIVNVFLPTVASDSSAAQPEVDPRRAQVDVAGFLGDEEASMFVRDLWSMMLDAQDSGVGIPRKLLEEKKKELAAQAAQKAASLSKSGSSAPLEKNLPLPLPPENRRADNQRYGTVRPVSPQRYPQRQDHREHWPNGNSREESARHRHRLHDDDWRTQNYPTGSFHDERRERNPYGEYRYDDEGSLHRGSSRSRGRRSAHETAASRRTQEYSNRREVERRNRQDREGTRNQRYQERRRSRSRSRDQYGRRPRRRRNSRSSSSSDSRSS
jgi:serine/arginine repetitive matrix protein 1